MVFCNGDYMYEDDFELKVTILILVDGFLQSFKHTDKKLADAVTILILIDGFLQ